MFLACPLVVLANPPKGLHLSDNDAKIMWGANGECKLEFKPGPPPWIDSTCPINAPPPAPSPPLEPPPTQPPPQKSSCMAWKAAGVTASGPQVIELSGTEYTVHCDMTTCGGDDAPGSASCGGWTLLEKSDEFHGDGSGPGSVPFLDTTDAINAAGLADPTQVGEDAKVSEAELKAFMLAGSGELLWIDQDTPAKYMLLRFTPTFINNWSTNLVYSTSTSWFEIYSFSTSAWGSINGHSSNVHFSTFNGNSPSNSLPTPTSPVLSGGYQNCPPPNQASNCYFRWKCLSCGDGGNDRNSILYFR